MWLYPTLCSGSAFHQSKMPSDGPQGSISSAPSSFHHPLTSSPVPLPTHSCCSRHAGPFAVPWTHQSQGLCTGSSVQNSLTPSLLSSLCSDVIFPPYVRLQPFHHHSCHPKSPLSCSIFFFYSTCHLLTHYQACLFCAPHTMIHISEGRNTSVSPTDDSSGT